MRRHVHVRIPATTANLGPGFDALGLALELHNRVTLTRLDSAATSRGHRAQVEVVVEGEGHGALPVDHRNLVYRAASAAYRTMGRRVPPLRLVAANGIPTARGLGSSAAAIVGGLVAANALEGGVLDDSQVLALATELEGHPDNVAAALLGGLVVSLRIGEVVVAERVPLADGLVAVLCIPDRPLSTAVARRVLPRRVTLKDAVFNLSRAALLVTALSTGEWRRLAVAMDDRLHQPARATIFPALMPVLEAAVAAGAAGAALSGAGSTMLALVEEASGRAQAVAAAMVAAATAAGAPAQALVARISPQGATVVDSNE